MALDRQYTATRGGTMVVTAGIEYTVAELEQEDPVALVETDVGSTNAVGTPRDVTIAGQGDSEGPALLNAATPGNLVTIGWKGKRQTLVTVNGRINTAEIALEETSNPTIGLLFSDNSDGTETAAELVGIADDYPRLAAAADISGEAQFQFSRVLQLDESDTLALTVVEGTDGETQIHDIMPGTTLSVIS